MKIDVAKPFVSINIAALIFCCLFYITVFAGEPVILNWQAVDSLNQNLPDGIQLYAAIDRELPLRAWYVRVEEDREQIYTQVVLSDDPQDRRENISSFARDLNACVVVNGGYFTMRKTPADHVGLIIDDGEILWPATNQVQRDSLIYPTLRAAIGFLPEHQIRIGYAGSRGKELLWSDCAAGNMPGQPAQELPAEATTDFAGGDVLAAGPRLLAGGELAITANEEVFFGTSIPATHPRTAAGVTADGDLLLLVVDGRQEMSRGVDLIELAQIMKQIGAVDALNLDGGGSSTMVVAGTLVNRPAGGTFQREVMSALAVFCTENDSVGIWQNQQ